MSNKREIIQSSIYVIFFTYFGVLTRLALTLLSDTASTSMLPQLGSPFFLANIFGSFIMGLTVPMVDTFNGKQYWFLGITSGFCGSCTTFSTWQKTTADLIILAQIVNSLLMSLLTFCTSFMAYFFGRHTSTCILIPLRRRKTSKSGVDQQQQAIANGTDQNAKQETKLMLNVDVVIWLIFVILITVALWSGVFLDHIEWRKQWCVSIALAPIGSLIRYATGLYNKKFPSFPVFTFLVNVCASVIGMALLVIQNFLTSNASGVKSYEFWAIDGVGTGVLGSLSTVSTFVNELYKFGAMNKTIWAYRYGAATFLVSQILCIAVGCVLFIK